MPKQRRTFSPEIKAKVALAAISEKYTNAQVASLYNVHPTQVKEWKVRAEKMLVNMFKDKRKKEGKEHKILIDNLYRIIGQRDVELDWLKKKLPIDSS